VASTNVITNCILFGIVSTFKRPDSALLYLFSPLFISPFFYFLFFLYYKLVLKTDEDKRNYLYFIKGINLLQGLSNCIFGFPLLKKPQFFKFNIMEAKEIDVKIHYFYDVINYFKFFVAFLYIWINEYQSFFILPFLTYFLFVCMSL
jgi:hypothetical protein